MQLTDARRARRTLFAAFVHFDVSFMIWVVLGPLALFIARDLDLSTTQKAFLVSVPPLGGAFFRIILGYCVDRFGAKPVGTISLLLTLVPLLLGYSWGDSFGVMLGCALLLGIAGASFAVALPIASRWYGPEKQGIAMGIAGAGNSGTVIATLFAPLLAARLGWHVTLLVATLPVLVALAVWTLCASDRPGIPRERSLAAYAALLRKPDTWTFCALYSVTFGGFLGLVSYLAIFLNTAYGVDKVRVGALVAGAAFMGSALRPAGGWIADRIGGVALLRAVYVAFAACAIAIAAQPPLAACVVVVSLAVGLLGMGNGAVFQLVPQRFAREIGAMTGIVGAAGGLGGFYLPNLLGVLRATTGSFAGGWLTFAALALGGAALVVLRGRAWATAGAAAPAYELAAVERAA